MLDTFRRVFGQVAVWLGKDSDLVILGFENDAFENDLARLERQFGRRDFHEQLLALPVSSFPRLVAHELLPPGVVHELELPNRIHTLLYPVLNDVAARAFYRKDEANVPIGLGRRAAEVGSRNSLGRKLFESDRGVETRLEYMREICELDREGHCTTFFAHWLHEDPEHPKLTESLAKARASPLFADVLKPESVQELADLYGRGATAQAPATFEFASELAAVYARYYHHAVPFDPASLHRAWQRCAESDARCHERLDEMLAQGLRPELLTSR